MRVCRRRGAHRAARKYLLGTDDQGRDILSALMYGARISLVVGVASVILSTLVGVSLGLLAGFRGGWIDAALMRICDVMSSFPPILVALLIAGVGRAVFPDASQLLAMGVLILSISMGSPAGCNMRARCAARRWWSAARSTCRRPA
jgi:peptide/nickel transport system permease protein